MPMLATELGEEGVWTGIYENDIYGIYEHEHVNCGGDVARTCLEASSQESCQAAQAFAVIG